MERPNTSSEGSLYELVARGQKDVLFYSKESDATVPYGYNIATWPAVLDETRETQPLNMVDFGRTVEWEFEVFGDVLISAAFAIDLPSWIPAAYQAANLKSVTADVNGARYGYTNGIAAFLFESIQFYADQLLLQEFSGDFLYAWTHFQGTLNQEVLALREMGAHQGTPLEIQRNATPPRLYLRLPLIGCGHPDEGGLPFTALPNQKFRLRARLRRLEDLVEASDSSVKPKPWGQIFTQTTNAGTASFPTLTREAIQRPLITLETTQRYVRQDLQGHLKKTRIEIPFLRPFENQLSLDPSDYKSVGNGGASYITKRLDGRHPAESLLVFFQSDYCLDRNQFWRLTNPYRGSNGAYYNGLKLVVAAKDRETIWDSEHWERLAPFVQAEKNSGIAVSMLSFTKAPSYGYRAPQRRRPQGTLNFTGADKPTLWFNLQDTLAGRTGQKRVVVRAVTTGWGVYVVEEGRGTLLYGN
jgi:hypothetical protein